MPPLSHSTSTSQLTLAQRTRSTSLADAAAAAFSHLRTPTAEGQLCASDCELLNAWGAVVRQLRKRTGDDDASQLTEEMLVESYLNERARIVREWPRSGEIPGTCGFFRRVDQLVDVVSEIGCLRFVPRLGYWHVRVSDLDPSYSPVIVESSAMLLYASSAVRQILEPEAIYRGAQIDLCELRSVGVHSSAAPVLDDDREFVGFSHTLSVDEQPGRQVISFASKLKPSDRPSLFRLVPIAFVSAVVLLHFLGGVAHSCLEL